ncbi:MAG: ABC transporter permease, partial [Cyclobacteriaceae bacterium]
MKTNRLPSWANAIIRWSIKEEYLEEILGDLKELYAIRKTDRSNLYCFFLLKVQLVLLLRPALIKSPAAAKNIHIMMLKTHFKIGLRSLWKFRTYTFINLFGLSFGAASAIILFMAAEYEDSYDLFLPEHEQVFRIAEKSPEIGEYYQTRTPVAPALETEYPEIIASTRMFNYGGWYTYEDRNIRSDIYLVDEGFGKVFQFEVLEGNLFKTLSEKGKIALTSSQAKKLFGYESALG